MFRTIIAVVIVFISLPVPAQVAPTLTDTSRIKSLIQSGIDYTNQSRSNQTAKDSALFFFMEAQKLANKLNLIEWQNKVSIQLGNWHLQQGQLAAGKQLYMTVANYHAGTRDTARLAVTWSALGTALPFGDSTENAEKIKCFEKSRGFYHLTHNKIAEATEIRKIGEVRSQSGSRYQAEQDLLQALDAYKAAGYSNLKVTYHSLAENSKLKGDPEKGLFYGLEMIKNMRANADTSTIDDAYYWVAETCADLGQYGESLGWAEKALQIVKKRSQYDDVYLTLALVLYDLIHLGKAEQALSRIKQAVNDRKPAGFIQQSMVNESMGDCYAALKKYETAELYYLKMVQFFEDYAAIKKEGNLDVVFVVAAAHTYKTIATFYINFNKYEKASHYINKLFALPKKLIKPLSLARMHFMQFKVDSAKNNLSAAIVHYQIYKQLNDSLFNETRSKQIAELQIKYQTETQEKEMQLLVIKEKLQFGELKKTIQVRNVTYALVGGLMLFIIAGYSRYRLKIKSNRQLQEQQREINLQNEKLTEHIASQHKLMDEKEWLLKEIHHRVKNNLQIVMSLLNSQSIYLKDDAARDAIKESQHRVRAISLIHQKLYQSKNLAVIEMGSYISEVVDYLADNLDADHRINFTVKIDKIELDVAQAIPLGLIINESVTNAVKYAFPGDKKGHVAITMSYSASDNIQLTIRDDGIGLPVNMDWRNTQTLGMNLMQGLCKQLDGAFNIQHTPGVSISVVFPFIASTLFKIQSNRVYR